MYMPRHVLASTLFLFFPLSLLLPRAADAQFSKTITVNPNVTVNAVTTWYYANCTTSLGVGSYTTLVAPMHGTVTFGQVSASLPGCPPGSPALPAEAAFYTWTDTTISPPSSDYFQLLYEAPDDESEVIDITVELPACAITSETLATVPGISNSSRTNIGVGESVLLATDVPVTWTITSAHGTLSKGLTPTDPKLFPPDEGFPSEQCSEATSSEPIVGTQACLTAGYSNDTNVITATLTDGTGTSCSTTLTAVQPTGLIFQRLRYPPPSGPDFALAVFGSEYWIQMESAVFVQPSDVSFAYIFFKELDIEPPFFGRHFNALADVGGTNAWLVSCDKDRDYFTEPKDPKYADWVYGNDRMPETAFSFVETGWSRSFVGLFADYDFTKKQVGALTANGSWMATPNAPAAALHVPNVPPAFYWDDVVVPSDGESCLNMVQSQFAPLQFSPPQFAPLAPPQFALPESETKSISVR
jgi:hypothetical protein